MVGPPFAGYLYDVTHEWFLSFGAGGAFIAMSGLMLLGLPTCQKAKQMSKRSNKKRRKSQEEQETSERHNEIVVAVEEGVTQPIDIPRRGDGSHVV